MYSNDSFVSPPAPLQRLLLDRSCYLKARPCTFPCINHITFYFIKYINYEARLIWFYIWLNLLTFNNLSYSKFSCFGQLTSLVLPIATTKSKNASKPAVCPGDPSCTWNVQMNFKIFSLKPLDWLMEQFIYKPIHSIKLKKATIMILETIELTEKIRGNYPLFFPHIHK